MDKNLKHNIDLLEENDSHVCENACRVLSALCENILNFPEEKQYREVRLDDPSVIENLLPAAGAMECLFDVGFVENEDHLLFPPNAPLSNVRTLQKLLLSKRRSSQSRPDVPVNSRKVNEPLTKERNFFMQITRNYRNVMRYEDRQLQQKSRKVVPITQLQINAMNRMRKLQRDYKINYLSKNSENQVHSPEDEITMKELFMLELLHWFKHDFFKWMDSPACNQCSGKCAFETVKPSSNPNCSRVEIHRCKVCNAQTEFPRYTDPEPLLIQKYGRCGEWANVFTLLCRALNYDARLVVDETDHIWTEIWLESSQRWIHVDPCENIVDQPLMYEKGWNKKLNYIIAYSKDEVQDVTWRYTRDHAAIMKRRKLCSESSLLSLILKLNAQRQEEMKFSEARKQYILKRRVMELASMLRTPHTHNPDDDKVYHGRTTGSYAWRLARGEVSEVNSQSRYVWDISKHGEYFELRYYIVKDLYRVIDQDGNVREEKLCWSKGVDTIEGNIFRKVEDDWKMAYLARAQDESSGKLTWKFSISRPNIYVHSLNLEARTETFHDGNITWEVVGYFDEDEKESITIAVPLATNFNTNKVKGAMKICITANVFGGNGDTAWQHAQLFRQSLDNIEDHSMSIKIHLANSKQ